MKRKLSKSTLVLVFFSFTLVLSVAGLFAMGSFFHPTYSIIAHKINYTPERVVLLENPDSYALEAINDGWSVGFLSWDVTDFDEKYYEAYDKFNSRFGYKRFYFEYNNSYYDMGLVVADNFPPAGLALSLLAGIVASITAIVVIGFYKTAKYLKSHIKVAK